MNPDRYNHPSLGLRFFAKSIDYLTALLLAFTLASLPMPPLISFFLCVTGFFLYAFLADGIPGGSLGKRLTRLAVVNWRTGAPCSYGESAIRNLSFIFMGGFLKLWQELEEEAEKEKERFTGTVVISLREQSQTRKDDPEREPMEFDLSGVTGRERRSKK